MILTVNGEDFNFFSNYIINLRYDSIASTFSFTALQDLAPEPLSFAECTVKDENGNLLITGTILRATYVLTRKSQPLTLEGYSKTGILEDCQIPADIYPLQSDKLTLKQIVDRVLAPFGIEYTVDASIVSEFFKIYQKSNAEPGESVKEYINRIVSQKGIILTHSKEGLLVFTKLQPELLTPVASFEEGNPGLIEATMILNSQPLHKEITVLRQASPRTPKALQYLQRNPYCDPLRTKTMILNTDSTDLSDIEKAARNELGSELEQAIRLSIKTTKFVGPGNLIEFKSPSLKINKATEFFVQGTTIIKDVRGDKYELDCVLKDVYTQDTPKNIFLQSEQNYGSRPRF